MSGGIAFHPSEALGKNSEEVAFYRPAKEAERNRRSENHLHKRHLLKWERWYLSKSRGAQE